MYRVLLRCLLFLPCFCLLFVSGCGGSDLPELGTVYGKVTLGGAPLADAIVNFSPVSPGRPSTAQTDAEGNYELVYLPDVDGAVVGEHAVTIEKIVTTELDDLPDDPSEMSAEERALVEANQPLPATASDGSLRKTVNSGSNEINIEL